MHKRIFARHPDCTRVPEYRFSIDPDGLVDFYLSLQTIWSPYYYDLKVKRLKRVLTSIGGNSLFLRAFTHYMRKFKVERLLPFHAVPAYSGIGFSRCSPRYGQLVDELIADLVEFEYPGQWNGTSFGERPQMYFASPEIRKELAAKLGKFWSAVIEDVCRYQKASFFVEDNTWNILWFDSILKLMPNARLVHVLRDPRDVVASYLRMRWSPNEVDKAAKWFKGIMNRWFEVRKQVPKDSFLEVRLHDLVQDPRKTLGEVTDFWGIPWSDRLLEENLGKSHTGRWKKDFDKRQQGVLNDILGEQIEQLGYE